MPYNDLNAKEMLQLINNTEVQYDDAWKGLSDECRDFVKQLLHKKMDSRMNANEAMNHPWITKNKSVYPYNFFISLANFKHKI